MRKQAAAIVILAGLLCGCGANPSAAEPNAVRTGSAQELKTEISTLADAVAAGTAIEDVTGEHGAVVPFAVGAHYAIADTKGTLLTDAVYDRVQRMDIGAETIWALRRGRTLTCIDRAGRVLLTEKRAKAKVCDDVYLTVSRSGKQPHTAVYDKKGNLLVQADGSLQSLSDDMLVTRDKRRHRWYITDVESGVTTRIRHVRHIGVFDGTYAAVQLDSAQWGLLSAKGEIVSLSNVVHMEDLCSGYALARNGEGAYGVIDRNGMEILPFAYRDGRVLSAEHAIFQLWAEDGTWLVRNESTGQKICLPSKYDGEELTAYPSHYYSYVNADGATVLFDDLVKLEFEPQTRLYAWNDTHMIVQSPEGCAVVDLQSGSVSEPLEQTAYVKDIGTDRCFVVKDTQSGQQGVVGTSGKLLLDTAYDWVCPMTDGQFAARKDGVCGLVDAEGSWLLRIAEP